MAFTSIPFLIAAIFLAGTAVAVVVWRRPALPRFTLTVAGIGIALLCTAAGGLEWRRPRPQRIVVMVDLSPSTRTAAYRDRARLSARIGELLGKLPHRIQYFADGSVAEPAGGTVLADVPTDQTALPADISTDAILLFSDAQFSIPKTLPRTYVVVDPMLENIADAKVERLELRGDEASIFVANSDQPRVLSLRGMAGATPTTAPSGDYTMTRHIAPGATLIAAQLGPGDAWPENDGLSAMPPPPAQTEQWWIGPRGSDPWRPFTAVSLPTDSAAYLTPSVIVLENVPIRELDDVRQNRLIQYVRDLGGALVIVGGNHAFAAGGYPGSALETMSPLASSPPRPTTHWMLLADGSGSMADTAASGSNKWRVATESLTKLLPHLPPDDLASVGSFAENLNWWSFGKSVRETETLALPPASAAPHGPTNLEAVLNDIAQSAEPALPKQLLVLTDADVDIRNPNALSAALHQKNIHLHVLAIEEGTGLTVLQKIVDATGGTLVEQLDPARWADSVAELMRSARPNLLRREPMSIAFIGRLAQLPGITAPIWNRTWLKASAEELAHNSTDPEHPPAAAMWQFGEGKVIATSFDAGPDAIAPLVKLVARPPRDPRFAVRWETGAKLRVVVDAIDQGAFLNGLHLSASLTEANAGSGSSVVSALSQIGPGRYELTVPAPRSTVFAAIREGDRTLDRVAIPGRYAPEFDAVGNDHSAMESIARRTGGSVIQPDRITPIDFAWPRRAFPLTPELAGLGALFIAVGLGYWRLK